MSSPDSSEKTEFLFICRICGKIGSRTMPAPIDFGGCVPPSKAHVFQKLEVLIKPAPAPAPTAPSK
jgi:hypothetical protein